MAGWRAFWRAFDQWPSVEQRRARRAYSVGDRRGRVGGGKARITTDGTG